MAETKEKAAKAAKAPKDGAAQAKGGKGGKEKGAAAAATDPSPKPAEGTPRLKTHYEQVVRPNLSKQFGLDYAIDYARNDAQEDFLYITLGQRF